MLRGKKSLCSPSCLMNLSVCMFLCPIPQGLLNIQVKKWKTDFLISSTPLHLVLSSPEHLAVMLEFKTKHCLAWISFIFPSVGSEKWNEDNVFVCMGFWSVFALQTNSSIMLAYTSGYLAHEHRCKHCFHDLHVPLVFFQLSHTSWCMTVLSSIAFSNSKWRIAVYITTVLMTESILVATEQNW